MSEVRVSVIWRRMSNPWKDSAVVDNAVTPLTHLLNIIQGSESDSKTVPESKGESSLVAKLKAADAITNRRRELKYRNKIENMYSETTLTNLLVTDLDVIFRSLSTDFQSFESDDLLQNAFQNTVFVNMSIKDNLNDDNRTKILELLRAAIRVIQKLKESKAGPIAIREEIFIKLIHITDIMNESKPESDYVIGDLFDLLKEVNIQIQELKKVHAFPTAAQLCIAKLDS